MTFLLGGEHRYDLISTYPFENKILNKDTDSAYLEANDTIIGSDVWIGHGCTILSGVKIGQGAVIGAKSIVCKNVPPYAIYGGNKVVKYRFDEETIEQLLKIDFSKLTKEDIINNLDSLYTVPDEKHSFKI